MSKLIGVASVVAELRSERENLKQQLSKLDEALAVLGSVNGASGGGVKRTMSLAARKRIAAAQRARWAKVRTSKSK
jgi:hypothetical protein